MSEKRANEISRLNEMLAYGGHQPLRGDATDGAIEQAQRLAFEVAVEREAYRISSIDGQRTPGQHEINAARPIARARLLSRKDKPGFLDRFAKALGSFGQRSLSGVAEIARERDALDEREDELLRHCEVFESLLNQRGEIARKVERARSRLAELKQLHATLTREIDQLFLTDFDPEYGTGIVAGLAELYGRLHAAGLAVADAARLEEQWAATIAAKDREIAEIERTRNFSA